MIRIVINPTRECRRYIMYTLFISLSSKTSPVVGSLTLPASTAPTFLLISISRAWPYTLPFGRTIESFST